MSRSIVAALVGTSVLMLVSPVYAVRVYESQLTENAICVQLSEQEVLSVQNDADSAQYLGRRTAEELIKLAGIPESITGKVAAFTAWVPMCEKYRLDIIRAAKKTPRGNPLTLKYRDVNLEGVRALWEASAVGDYILPGGELTNTAADAVNKIINLYVTGKQ